MKKMATLAKEDRPRFGQIVNEVKNELEKLYQELESVLGAKELEQKMLHEKLDLGLPGKPGILGAFHPVRLVIEEMTEILSHLGYSLRQGPWIETDYYNFEALNLPPDHPAREMQDTFFVDLESTEPLVLRTQTSPIQIRVMQKEPPPLRILGSGAVFRRDHDLSHLPHFHQMEGLCVDRSISMADLRGTIQFFMKEFFQVDLKVRFRPSFFPFTEPSAEVDLTCPSCQGKGCGLCKHTGWIEVGGCGLVHPQVLINSGLDPDQWQGFAFGFGIERLAMIKYRIKDIRLFPENDLRFLRQFRVCSV
jgi:phenylalanyl-tRNA synthetase alpha chain